MSLDLKKEDIGKLLEINLKEKAKDGKQIIHKGFLVEFNSNDLKVKLEDNGYNIGIDLKHIEKINFLDKKVTLGKPSKINLKENKDLPNVYYIGTGGTIGTHVDYNTGGVYMCRSPEEIISTTPEIANIINIKQTSSVVMKGSEDMTFNDWALISSEVFKAISDSNIDGVIITHGTDTLSLTGSAISFMIEGINKPVLLIGAQRSPDRASFDGSMNLICASHFIKEKIPGVFTVMHGSMNDDFCYVIRSTKSKKMHTSRRDSFRAVNDKPIAKVYKNGKIEYLKDKKELILEYQKKFEKPVLKNKFSEKVEIIKAYPSSNPEVIDFFVEKGCKGLIIEGTALGHVPTLYDKDKDSYGKESWIPSIKKAVEKGLIIIMTSQSVFGRVNSKVYANLRYAKNAGVNYLDSHDMLCDVAYIKLSLALERFKEKQDVLEYMKTNVSGEISEKELADSFESSLENL
ncbi:MAG: Glu-tRNA(Gln) amidotransferase subunit GatD [Candidatus ainarchaeum sp.]|nr:Glu-tRNA(Gln) amidotransferase subunit GatD [Candidatus ainarchaeum sp.]MDD3975814.1 Glu-tRNA(Gln) amidotransferase subunit GatD [Candidatus ainarchaeum sp.]